MLAVLKDKPFSKSIIVKDVKKPCLKPGYLIAKVDAAGICGTDVHIYNWEVGYRKRLQNSMPVIMGHEFTGVIEEMDGESSLLKIGDRIVAIPGISCGECYYCRSGSSEICLNRQGSGLERNGAMAEYILMKKENCFFFFCDFQIDVAATIEPMSIAYNAIAKAGSLLGKNVAIIGPGAIGYFACLFANLAGTSSVSILGLSQDQLRLDIFRKNIPGINIFTDKEEILGIRNGLGVDVILEISGSNGGLNTAIELAKKRAAIILVGIPSQPMTIDAITMVRNEYRLLGTHAMPPRLWLELIGLLSSLSIDDLNRFAAAVTHKYPIINAKTAFKTAEECKGLKVLLLP